jgi:4-carboxymuconolactone decarboxylase
MMKTMLTALMVPLVALATVAGAQPARSTAAGAATTDIGLTGVRDGRDTEEGGKRLKAEHAAIATIAAFTASGDQERLRQALNKGLDVGVTVNEIKEVLVQMYAYAGFPRSLNGVSTFMAVVQQRRDAGIRDEMGPEPSPLPTDKSSVELGTENQTRLIGAPATGGYITFTPALDQFLKGHLFGDIFGRDNLDWQSREVATIAALANMTGLNAQLESHFRAGLNTGLTASELRGLVSVLRTEVGKKQAQNAARVLDKVLQAR